MPPSTQAASQVLSADQVFWLCLIVGALGIGLVWAIVWFGRRMFDESQYDFWGLAKFLDFWKQQNIRPNLPRYFVDALTESLQRRNEFWMTYGQIVVAVLIIIILTILLLTKTISAEAGLPLLSAVSGFAIAKGVNSNRSGTSGPDRDQG
ncbi:hypothetical protein [Polaromonas sp. LjRoot131]|uniref:hypothetical protein n=1 Tax=Polaromonas sp. LjRoot131 TaxID=3342262 RepID=UPI003ECCC08F